LTLFYIKKIVFIDLKNEMKEPVPMKKNTKVTLLKL